MECSTCGRMRLYTRLASKHAATLTFSLTVLRASPSRCFTSEADERQNRSRARFGDALAASGVAKVASIPIPAASDFSTYLDPLEDIRHLAGSLRLDEDYRRSRTVQTPTNGDPNAFSEPHLRRGIFVEERDSDLQTIHLRPRIRSSESDVCQMSASG